MARHSGDGLFEHGNVAVRGTETVAVDAVAVAVEAVAIAVDAIAIVAVEAVAVGVERSLLFDNVVVDIVVDDLIERSQRLKWSQGLVNRGQGGQRGTVVADGGGRGGSQVLLTTVSKATASEGASSSSSEPSGSALATMETVGHGSGHKES